MAQTTRTIDHDEIRDWVESRGGGPAVIEGTHEGSNGILRVDFGLEDEAIEPVTWEDFFKVFDANDLAFLYQEESDDGGETYFCRFVARSEPDDGLDDGDDADSGDVSGI